MSLSLTRSCIAKCTLHKNLRVLLCLLHPFHRNPPPSLSFFIWHREFLGLYPTLGASLVVVARRRVSLPEVLPATSAITRTCCACCFPHAGGLARCTTKCATLTTTRTRTLYNEVCNVDDDEDTDSVSKEAFAQIALLYNLRLPPEFLSPDVGPGPARP